MYKSQGGDNASYVTNGVVNGITKGNYSGTQEEGDKVIATGSNEDYKVNNIYDMAGNIQEWTIQAIYISGRIFRGGYYGGDASSYSVSHKGGINPDYYHNSYGSRSALFVTLIPSGEN